jgi:hypothetical protein
VAVIKFKAEREGGVPVLGLVLEPGNLVELRKHRPIPINGADLGVEGRFVIVYSATRESLVEELQPLLSQFCGESEEVKCMHMAESFYLMPLNMENTDASRQSILYLIGLDDVSCDKLQARQVFSFRVRHGQPGEDGQLPPAASGVEVMLWLADKEEVEVDMRKLGFVAPGA